MENKENLENVLKEDETVTETAENDQIDLNSYKETEETFSLSDFMGEGNFVRKKRGFGGWWRERKTWQKTLMIISLVLVIAVSAVAAVFMTSFGYNYNSITKNPNDLGFENVLDENIVNVALFGIDTRSLKSFEGNSDSIMILSLNTITKKVKIVSVMRDTFTPITYNGKTRYGKINSAYAKGGPELAIKTLNTIFGLDISEYATVNFFGMVDIIDAVGGVEAELTQSEVTRNTRIKALNFCIKELCSKLKLKAEDYYIYEPGVHKLNGVQAVAYSRIRYVANIWGTNNDYGRTDRQRYVMEQLFNKALTIDKSQYVKLAKSLIPCTETSLSYKEIMGLAFDMLLESPSFEQTRMPQQEFIMNSPSGYGSVVYYDLDFAKKIIHAFIYEDVSPEKYIAANGIEMFDWYGNRYSGNTQGSNNANNGSNSVGEGQITNSGVVGSDGQTSVPDTNTGIQNSTVSGTQSDDTDSDTDYPFWNEDDDSDISATDSEVSSDVDSSGSSNDNSVDDGADSSVESGVESGGDLSGDGSGDQSGSQSGSQSSDSGGSSGTQSDPNGSLGSNPTGGNENGSGNTTTTPATGS